MYTQIYYVHICSSFTHVKCKHTISYIGCIYVSTGSFQRWPPMVPWPQLLHNLSLAESHFGTVFNRMSVKNSQSSRVSSSTFHHHHHHHHHPYTKGCPHPMDHKNHVDPSCVVFMILFELPIAGDTSNNIKHRPMRSLLHVAAQYLRKIPKVTASYEVEIFKVLGRPPTRIAKSLAVTLAFLKPCDLLRAQIVHNLYYSNTVFWVPKVCREMQIWTIYPGRYDRIDRIGQALALCTSVMCTTYQDHPHEPENARLAFSHSVWSWLLTCISRYFLDTGCRINQG